MKFPRFLKDCNLVNPKLDLRLKIDKQNRGERECYTDLKLTAKGNFMLKSLLTGYGHWHFHGWWLLEKPSFLIALAFEPRLSINEQPCAVHPQRSRHSLDDPCSWWVIKRSSAHQDQNQWHKCDCSRPFSCQHTPLWWILDNIWFRKECATHACAHRRFILRSL